MASTKDIFEAKTFAANMFAAGVWRGTGVAVQVPDVPGLEYRDSGERMHYAEASPRMHYRETGRMHYDARE